MKPHLDPDFATLYCRSLTCADFNERQHKAITPATWHQPAELSDDTCDTCGSVLWEDPLDVDDLIVALTNPLGELEAPHQRELAQAYLNAYAQHQDTHKDNRPHPLEMTE